MLLDAAPAWPRTSPCMEREAWAIKIHDFPLLIPLGSPAAPGSILGRCCTTGPSPRKALTSPTSSCLWRRSRLWLGGWDWLCSAGM